MPRVTGSIPARGKNFLLSVLLWLGAYFRSTMKDWRENAMLAAVILLTMAGQCLSFPTDTSQCMHTEESGSGGIITSPGYPKNYTVNLNIRCEKGNKLGGRCYDCYTQCSWTITVPPDFFISLVFTYLQFDASYTKICHHALEVYDGPTDSVNTALAGLVGEGRSDTYTSTGNTMHIRMISTHYKPSISPDRFTATWIAVCFKEFRGSFGNVTSQNFPRSYPVNQDCSYLINQPDGYNVTVSFVSISLDPVVDSNCSVSDHVMVYDGDSVFSPLLGGPYCQGSTLPITLTATQNKVLVKFRSDNRTVSSTTGFHLNYIRILPMSSQIVTITLNSTSPTRNISSPAYPRRFPEEGNYTWLVDSSSKLFVVQLNLTSVELGAYSASNDVPDNAGCDRTSVTSELLIYNGKTDTDESTLLARYCNRNIFPHTILSSGRNMFIKFRSKNLQKVQWWLMGSDLGNSINGFQATISRVNKGVIFADREPILEVISYGSGFDKNVTKYPNGSKYYVNPQLVELPSYIPVENRLFKYIFIFQTGKIAFSAKNVYVEKWKDWNEESCSKRSYDHICAYCSNINVDDIQTNIYYNNYPKSNDNAVQDVNRIVNRFKGTTDFSASITVVVSWHKVRNKDSGAYNGFATFQIAIAASETESYVIMLYRRNNMLWVSPPNVTFKIYAGFTTKTSTLPQCRDFYFSNTDKMLKVDDLNGNMGDKGVWVFKLGELDAGAQTECDDWYNRNLKLNTRAQMFFSKLPECPCLPTEVKAQGSWLYSFQRQESTLNCYRLTKAASNNYYPAGKECCYYSNSSMLAVDHPDAGSATLYNPAYPEDYQNYVKEDLLGYDACCVRANSTTHCRQFYDLRPIGNCSKIITDGMKAFFMGDPYILTLDGREFHFNGRGEYIMYELTTSTGKKSTMQARVDLVQIPPGHYSNGTIFTAFGVSEGAAVVFVQLDPNTNDSFIIYGKGVDFSRRFYNDEHFLVDEDEYSMQRSNLSLRLLFPSGVVIEFTIRIRSLAASLAIPTEYKGLVKGFLGNYNGQKTDDFILPNGTSLGASLTEREIFEKFGPAWAVTAENTIMRYGPGESVSTYAHPEFVPLFLDEQPESVLVEGRALCGNNTACMYDYLATGSAAFALDTKQAMEAADLENNLLKNSVPYLEVPSKIEVMSGVLKTFALKARDPEGDIVTYHAEDSNEGTVLVQSSTGLVQYTPALNNTATLRFFAKDSKQLTSVSRVVEVYICSGCNGHGTCSFSSVNRDLSYYVHLVECVCDPAWTGDDCDMEVNGCLPNPCVEGQTCRDLSPQEQGSSVISFDCGACPQGYTKDGVTCLDIDECQTNNGGCQMSCSNTQGSFRCGCNSGYRLHLNSRQCQDVDECTEGTSDCDQLCSNTQGSYQCQCVEGYTYDVARRMCIQEQSLAQECRFSGCSQGCKRATGLNKTDAILCFCFAGFTNSTEDNTVCADKDECQSSICDQRCFNLPGGFVCGCNNGYKLAGDGTSCLPCTGLTYGPACQYTCTCTGHGTRCDPVTGCVCEAGWRGTFCQEEVDECMETPNVCGSDKVCRNTPGSYTCNCLAGYTKDVSGKCVDIDECGKLSLLNTCEPPKICTNIPGSFLCSCPQGYIFNSDGFCENIDECAHFISPCQQKCEDVEGSFNCDCYNGYRLSSDRSSCTKVVDVCGGISCSHGCQLNDQGNPICFCNIGYILANDQISCTRTFNCSTAGCSHSCQTVDDKPVCECPAGMKLNNDRKTCAACPNGTYGLNCASNCSCGVGANRCDVSTGCVCRGGWTGVRCDQDINECSTVAVQEECRAKNAACINNPGSYQCRCGDGISEDLDGVCYSTKNCTREDCPTVNGGCSVAGSNEQCFCNSGYQLSANGTLCTQSATKICTRKDCPTVNGGCSVAGSNEQCFCNSGYQLSENSTLCTQNDSGPSNGSCSRSDCPTVNGGCRQEQCFCNPGFNLSIDSSTCNTLAQRGNCSTAICEQLCREVQDQALYSCSCLQGFTLNDDQKTCRNLRTIQLEIRVDVNISKTAEELANKSSTGYLQLAADVIRELNSTKLQAERGVDDIRIDNLSIGSLIIELSIWVDTAKQPNIMFSIASLLSSLDEGQLTIEGQSGQVTYFAVDKTAVSPDDSACVVLEILTTCPTDQQCVVDNGLPSCRLLVGTGPDDKGKNLEIGLGIGLGLGLGIPLIVAMFFVCLCKKKMKSIAQQVRAVTPIEEREFIETDDRPWSSSTQRSITVSLRDLEFNSEQQPPADHQRPGTRESITRSNRQALFQRR